MIKAVKTGQVDILFPHLNHIHYFYFLADLTDLTFTGQVDILFPHLNHIHTLVIEKIISYLLFIIFYLLPIIY